MKVFFEDADVVVYHGNNLEVLAALPENSVDVTVTSPPYNTQMVGNGNLKPSGFRKESAMARNLEKMTSGYTDALPEPEYQKQQVEVLNAVHRVTRESGSIFWNHKCRWRDKVLLHPLDIFRQSEWRLRMEIVWDRGVGLTLNARRFYDQDERLYWGYKGSDWRWNQAAVGYGSVWRLNPQAYKQHACVFPEPLVGRCLSGVAQPGHVVLDPYAGSGTVAAVSRKHGCKTILIEREERYCEVIVERLSQQVLPMFAEEDTLI